MSAATQMASDVLLATENPCRVCGAPKVHDHHFIPKGAMRAEGLAEFIPTATVPLCARCHGIAHGRSRFVRMQPLSRKAIELRRARGLQPNGSPRFGYQWANGTVVPYAPEQACLARIRAMDEAGASHDEIAEALNAAGMMARGMGGRGTGAWNRKRVHLRLKAMGLTRKNGRGRSGSAGERR